MTQDTRSTGTVVVARSTSKNPWPGFSLATADLDDLYRSAVLGIKGQRPFGGAVNRVELDQMADAMAATNLTVYTVSFYVAAAMYEPLSGWGDPTRREAMDFLQDQCGVTSSNARRACDTVDIAASVTIDEDTVGIPTIGQLNRIARANIKKIGGWGKVNAWVKRKGGWGNVSPDAISSYCQKVDADAKAEEHDRKALQTAEDEHPPADANVVDGTAVEVADAELEPEPERPRTPLNTVEQSAAVRLAHSIDAFEQLMAAGASMAANLEAFDRPPEWLQLRASDFRNTERAIARLKPMMDAATKPRAA
jgi:hypothetical protein